MKKYIKEYRLCKRSSGTIERHLKVNESGILIRIHNTPYYKGIKIL